MVESKLVVEGLRKTFGEETAVDGLSVNVAEGEFRSLLGPSGCGKTTTLRCIAGIEKPNAGRIHIGDTLVSAPEENIHVKPENREIGMVFQSYAIWPHMTVRGNIMYPLNVRKKGTKEEREQKVRETLEMVGLDGYEDTMATNLSGGQQQRVAISRALVIEPEILLFDEPLSNLDAKLRREMRMEIKNICEEMDITVLYVTHAQDEAMFLSDSISLMNDGNIVEEDDPQSLHTNPQTLFAMDFMGHSNHVNGYVVETDSSASIVDTHIGTFEIPTHKQDILSGDEVVLSFRPKFCGILDNGAQVLDGKNVHTMDGEVEMVAPTRDFTEYHVSVNNQDLLVRDTKPLPYDKGDRIQFFLNNEDVKVFLGGQSLV